MTFFLFLERTRETARKDRGYTAWLMCPDVNHMVCAHVMPSAYIPQTSTRACNDLPTLFRVYLLATAMLLREQIDYKL